MRRISALMASRVQFSLVPAARPERMHEDSVETGDCSVAAVHCCFVEIDVDIGMVVLHV